MSKATALSSITVADENQETMDRVAPNEETVNPAENASISDEGLALKENKPSWFCKLVVSRPLSVFGMLL
jgi:hypothetical protein